MVDGEKIKKMVLKGDDQGTPDVITLGKLEMWVIKREDQYGIRMRDLEAAPYKNYKGLDFYPPSEKFKIEAEFIPYQMLGIFKDLEAGARAGETLEEMRARAEKVTKMRRLRRVLTNER